MKNSSLGEKYIRQINEIVDISIAERKLKEQIEKMKKIEQQASIVSPKKK